MSTYAGTVAAQDNVSFLDLAAMHAEVQPELDAAWSEVSAQNAFVGGPWVDQFERDWAAFCGRRYCVGTANGTDALVIALLAAGVGPGHEVALPANTFIATAEAILAVGARPVFTDVDPLTLLMTGAHLADAITPSMRAVIPVHLFGQPVAMDELAAVARDHGLTVIEDAAQAHGATWRGAPAGSFGAVAAWSFYPGKNLGALGDAGAITTDDPEIAEAARSIGNHGSAPGLRYIHPRVGMNSRLDGLQAAMLSVKLRRLEGWNAARERVARAYDARLADIEGVARVQVAADARSSHHLYVIRVAERTRVQVELTALGIETGIHYPIPCHLHEPYREYASAPLPVVEGAAREILSLPMSPHLTDHQVDRVCEALASAVTHA